MKIISFAWTTAALLAGRKTCTRRAWTANFAKQFHAGDLVAAYNRNPRNRGYQIGTIRLMAAPELSNTAEMTDEDYEQEGLAWMEEMGLLIRGKLPRVFWQEWKAAKELVYVIRFTTVSLSIPRALNSSEVRELSKQISDDVGLGLL